jgi:hypothetical protein
MFPYDHSENPTIKINGRSSEVICHFETARVFLPIIIVHFCISITQYYAHPCSLFGMKSAGSIKDSID